MIGKRFGRYAITGDLGSGGMGNVLRARDAVLGRDVALKLLHAGDDPASRDESMRVILREARAAAAIDHPNAVAIFDVGEIEGQPFMAMELVVGRTLRDAISERDTPLALRVAWLVDVANALAAAHRGGLLHRDIKPENVMVRDDGVVKVVDFGIARPLAAIDRDAATKSMRLDEVVSFDAKSAPMLTAGIRGTPGYMAPEQLRGEGLDGRADQFAWGILACELLTGEHPWPRGDALALVRAITTEAAPSLRWRERALGEGVDRIVLRALEKRREARFGSMDELVSALLAEGWVLEEPEAKRPIFTAGRALFAAAALVMIGAAATPEQAREPVHPRALAKASPAYVATPEAAAKYREGVELVRDGSRSAAVAAFDRAAAIDPTYAAAHLRAAMLAENPDSAMRTHLQMAAQFRSGLSEYERRLLWAFEPLANAPADWNESARRLVEVTHQYPERGDAWLALGSARFHAADSEGALFALDTAIALDPRVALGWAEKARLYRAQNDLRAARDAYERCSEASPASQSCLRENIVFLRANGRCRDEVPLCIKLVALAPDDGDGYRQLANAHYGAGEIEEARKALDDVRVPAESRERLANMTHLAVLEGDFALAEANAEKWEASVVSTPDEPAHLSPAWYRMMIALETGHEQSAIALARQYLSRRAGWIPNDFTRSPVMYVVDVLYRAGSIDRAEMTRMRNDWLEEERTRWAKTGDSRPAFAWIVGFAQTAVTREDALDAIAQAPAGEPLPSAVNGGLDFEAPLGELFRLAGMLEVSRAHLDVAANACQAVDYPFQHVWSWLRLARLDESVRNTAAACDEYRAVSMKWGRSRTSRSAAEASSGWRRLHCR